MDDVDIVGQVIGGEFGDIIIREKSGKNLEIGDLIVSEEAGGILILQVFSLEYGSQIQERMQQMMSGVNMEQGASNAEFYEPEFVNYVLARIKALARVSSSNTVTMPKSLPSFFNKLRLITSADLKFLTKGENEILLGNVRSGTKVIDAEVWINAEDVFSHHVLIPATTGRGKSNLVKTILWHVLDTNKVGALVLDAHDEYFGRHGVGLKDHPKAKDNLVYYTPNNPPAGSNRLAINLQSLKPEHFFGLVEFTSAQSEAIRAYYRNDRDFWIAHIMQEDLIEGVQPVTLIVLKRKLRLILGLDVDDDGHLFSHNEVFDPGTRGLTLIDDIIKDIESGKVVILDTSRLVDEAELIVGNVIASQIFDRYKEYKVTGELARKPVVTVIIEEAPRVISEEVLNKQGKNIYSTIAKEGRKFKIGLTAITQLSSVIPKQILANLNTKIILGNEMRQEREAIIASASQDLSADDRNIASLDIGEAIISSIFVPFAIPIKIPLFEDLVKQKPVQTQVKQKVF